ncbi:MAG: hypothetical protein RIC87_08495 [Kiloniellales bacterium]
MKRMVLGVLSVSLLLAAGPALADRPATPEEMAKVTEALAAIGCTPYDVEWDEDDARFEADDARCGDHGRFDFELDQTYAIVDGERPVTADERTAIDAALQKEGCSGGMAEFDYDDDRFEIDEAVCSDQQRYEIKLDRSFKLIRKSLDD